MGDFLVIFFFIQGSTKTFLPDVSEIETHQVPYKSSASKGKIYQHFLSSCTLAACPTHASRPVKIAFSSLCHSTKILSAILSHTSSLTYTVYLEQLCVGKSDLLFILEWDLCLNQRPVPRSKQGCWRSNSKHQMAGYVLSAKTKAGQHGS